MTIGSSVRFVASRDTLIAYVWVARLRIADLRTLQSRVVAVGSPDSAGASAFVPGGKSIAYGYGARIYLGDIR